MKPVFSLTLRAIGVAAALVAANASVAQSVGAAVGRATPSAGQQIGSAPRVTQQSPNATTVTPPATVAGDASGLRSSFPAGLPTPVAPGGATTNVVVDGVLVDSVPATQVMGAGGGGYTRSAPQYTASGPGPYTALDVASSFLNADANRDGDLTRAEATRLLIQPFPFEEMDRNRDNILSKSEYEDALR